jgi:hypothetical protein
MGKGIGQLQAMELVQFFMSLHFGVWEFTYWVVDKTTVFYDIDIHPGGYK